MICHINGRPCVGWVYLKKGARKMYKVMEELAGGWWKFHNEKHHNLYSLPDITRNEARRLIYFHPIILNSIVTWHLKGGIPEPEETVIDRLRLGKHTPATADTQEAIEEPRVLLVIAVAVCVVGHVHGSEGISSVRSPYQATIGEDRTNWENLMCTIMTCRVCRLVRIIIICSYES
jgi:hypothetical protein